MSLHVARGLELPLEAVTMTFAILAIRGVGKTYTGMVMTEEMTAAGIPVVVLDPVGVWWGLRSSADGKRAGLPIIVLGGDHGDVPLEATAGRVIADWIVRTRHSCILDMSHFRKGEQRRFVADFGERLYRKNREPLHLMVDEADAFAPQKCRPDSARMLGAMEDLVRRGRARGIGLTLITQRSAVLNKDVLTQVECLIAMRTVSPQDRKAVEAWIDVHDDKGERKRVMASLPSLKIGEAWFWSPGWLGILSKHKIRKRRTFDSSATPKMGKKIVKPKLAPVDLDALGAEIAETIERHQQEDPQHLRARIRELEKQLKKRPAAAAKTIEVEVEVPVVHALALERATDLRLALEEADQAEAKVRVRAKRLEELLRKAPTKTTKLTPPVDVLMGAGTSARMGPRTPTAKKSNGAGASLAVAKGERAVLVAAAQYPDDGVTRKQITILTGYKRSTRDAYIQRLRVAELVEQRGDRIHATAAGVEALGDSYQPLPTGQALRTHWLDRLPEGEGKILAVLVADYPSDVQRDAISERTGYKRSTRDAYIQRLDARQLITRGAGTVRASDTLFS